MPIDIRSPGLSNVLAFLVLVLAIVFLFVPGIPAVAATLILLAVLALAVLVR